MPYDNPAPPLSRSVDHNIRAVLGPTNTGKTHYALDRMLAHRTGVIGLPLRLLAREVYDRIVAQVGQQAVALVTGEEKITPRSPRYWVATVEAMPLDRDAAFVAIDEIQLAADAERGRVFTSRLLHARGSEETLFLGSDTMRPILRQLFGDIEFVPRERFSALTYAGHKKVTRLPRRSAIVGFSADTVYATAELIRRQRGGAAVILGALSPRTRNAQAALYQNGDVDFLVATDAIGMGLNMDIDHVAFAATRKFDGRRMRNLSPAETAQVAGRAGRHIRDGTFGSTADCPLFDEETVEAIENHNFDPVKALQWRTEQIDLSSVPALLNSLERPPPRKELLRSRREDDEDTLNRLLTYDDIRQAASGGAALATLWDICQTPDFRKVSLDQHARLLADVFEMLMEKGRLDDAFFEPRVSPLDRTDGDIDALSARIAHIRTWTYLSNRAGWVENAAYWQDRTRAIEETLSDALHEKLTQRFVDRRTSALIKKLKDDAPLLAGVTDDGEVIVEGQFVGRLLGFDFVVDPRASGAEAKSLRAAGQKALRPVLAVRAAALANADADEISLREDGTIWWRSAQIATLAKGPAPLRPDVMISGLDAITPNMRGRVEDRVREFIASKIEGLLGPLINLQNAADKADGDDALNAVSRGVAFRLVENFGATSRAQFGDELKQIDQEERAKLRKIGVRFGEYTLHLPALLKPAPAALLTFLWALWSDRSTADVPVPKAGLVSIPTSENLPHAYYYAAGYRPSGERAVRIDMLERLANLIRTARNEANSKEGFEATSQMMSLVGCSGEPFESILRSLGFRKNTVKRARKPEAPETSTTPPGPETPAPDTAAPSGETAETPASPEAQTAEAKDAPTPESAPAPDTTAAGAEDIASEQKPNNERAATDQGAGEKSSDPGTEDAPATENNPSATTEATPSTDAPAVTEEDVTLWRLAPRKPPQRPRRDARGDKQGQARGKPGKGKGQRKGAAPGGGRGRKGPPREKKADPNSPFAVLAGLKSELSKAEKDSADKSPEKAK